MYDLITSDFCPLIEHDPDTFTGFELFLRKPHITASVGSACKTILILKTYGRVKA